LARESKIYVWDEGKLNYYLTLVDTLGPYAKYEIINSFGITTDEEQLIHNCLALLIKQPFTDSSTNLFLFTLSPQKLLKSSVIFRRAQGGKEAYQRMIKKARLKSIKKFVSKKDSLLPTNIIVYFNDPINYTSIPLPKKDSNGNVISLTRKNCELVNLR
jgi:hypothetical protein